MFESRCCRLWGQYPLIVLVAVLLLLVTTTVFAEEYYWVHKVRPGENIWDLTERHTVNVQHWKRIQSINGIPDTPARRIRPGTRLRFPLDILKHQPASATIIQIQGAVQLTAVNGDSKLAAASTELVSGDTLVTDKKSNLTIRFADGSELLLLGDSRVTMDSLSAYGDTGMVDTRLRLQSGQVDTRAKPSKGPGSRYEITTPAAVAAVRGTEFRVSAEKNEPVSRSEVLEGVVAVASDHSSQRVPAGYGVVTEQGKAPEKARPLLPPPDLSSMDTHIDRLPLQFTWSRLDDAQGYRFQIAPSTAFDRLLADGSTKTERASLSDLPDGEYVIQVRGVDEVGLEGLNTRQSFVVDARPEPPVPLGLTGGTTVREPQPEFGWTKPEAIDTYHLQISQDKAFDQLLYDQARYTQEKFVPPGELQAGTYFWRIASIKPDGEQGPYSDRLSFTYKPVPDRPNLTVPKTGESDLKIQWSSVGEGMQYHLQVAHDPKFTDLILDRTLDEPRVSLAKPLPGRYYLRARAIDETGVSGPYSTVQYFDLADNYWPLLIAIGAFLLLI